MEAGGGDSSWAEGVGGYALSTPERLAYWYLRLNGFLTTENFVVHPDSGGEQRTDADLLGVRFKGRAENLERPMKDDPRVCDVAEHVNVIIAETKRSDCALNGPWTRSEDRNIQRVLAAIGCLPESELEQAAQEIYRRGDFSIGMVKIRLMAFGDVRAQLTPNVEQVTFDEMIEFIWQRFTKYQPQKKSVGNWNDDGVRLRDLCPSSKTPLDQFRAGTRCLFGLRSEPPIRRSSQ